MNTQNSKVTAEGAGNLNYQAKDGHKNPPNRVNQYGKKPENQNPLRSKNGLLPRMNLSPKKIIKDQAKAEMIGLIAGSGIAGGGTLIWLLS